MSGDTLIPLSISNWFLGKENTAPEKWSEREQGMSSNWAYGAFENVEFLPAEIAWHLAEENKTICVASLKNPPGRKQAANFDRARLLGIDLDKGPDVKVLADDPVIRDHAFFLYRTSSWTPEINKSRVLFSTDEDITDWLVYRDYISRLLYHFKNANADAACKDAVRIFYGTNQPDYILRPDRVLPLSLLNQLPAPPPPPTAEPKDWSSISAQDDKAIILDALRAIPPASIEYNDWLSCLAALYHLYGLSEAISIGDAWSGWCSRPNEIAGRISSFENGSPANPAGAGTIIYLAKQSGWQPPRRDSAKSGQNNHQSDHNWNGVDVREAAPSATAAPVTPPEPAATWHTSDESLDVYEQRLTGELIDTSFSLQFPFRVLAEAAGGFCDEVPAGILIGILGDTGGMKTSFTETLTDAWRKDGSDGPNHTLWWGPEWPWKRMSDRAIQRQGGATMVEMMKHEKWHREAQKGIPENRRRGKRLRDDVLAFTLKIKADLKAWPGKNHFVEELDLDIDGLLVAFQERVDALAALGEPIRVAVFDYVQLMDLNNVRSEAERINLVLAKIKRFVVKNQLIGIVVSQTTKLMGRAMREGETLGADSGQFVRSDKFNLVLTLNPIYDGKMLTDKGTISVAKNSSGGTPEKTVRINPSKFMWTDSEAPHDPKQQSTRKAVR